MRASTLVTILASLVLAGGLGCVVPVPYPMHAVRPPGLRHHPHGGPPGQMKKHRRQVVDALMLEHDDPMILVVVSPRLGFDCWRHGDHYHCRR